MLSVFGSPWAVPAGVEHVRSDVVLHDVCCVLARLLTDHVGLLCQYVVGVLGVFRGACRCETLPKCCGLVCVVPDCSCVWLPVILVGVVYYSCGCGSEH